MKWREITIALCLIRIARLDASKLKFAPIAKGSRKNNLAFCCGPRRNYNIVATVPRPAPMFRALGSRNPAGRGGGRASAAMSPHRLRRATLHLPPRRSERAPS